MAYDTEVLKKKAIEAINRNKLLFVEDICAYIGINKTTYYVHFPIDSNDNNELSEMLEKNKIDLKVGMRKKWYDSENATMQMALYKLCSTPEEHKKLQQNYSDITSDGKQINPTIIVRDSDTAKIVDDLMNGE